MKNGQEMLASLIGLESIRAIAIWHAGLVSKFDAVNRILLHLALHLKLPQQRIYYSDVTGWDALSSIQSLHAVVYQMPRPINKIVECCGYIAGTWNSIAHSSLKVKQFILSGANIICGILRKVTVGFLATD